MITLRSKKNKNNFSLYLDIYHKGKRSFEFMGLHTSKNYTNGKIKRVDNQKDKIVLNLANEILLKRLSEFIASEYKLPNAAKRKQGVLLLEYFNEVARTKSNGTYTAALSHLTKFIGDKKIYLHTVDSDYLKKFQDYLKGLKLSDTSVHHYVNRLIIVLNDAVKKGLIDKINLSTFEVIKTNEKDKEYLQQDELQKLIDCDCDIDPNTRFAFLFSYFAGGIRLSDMEQMTWGNVKGKTLNYTPYKTRNTTKHQHSVPISEQAQTILEVVKTLNGGNIKETDKIFLLPSRTSIKKYLTKWVEAAGLNKHISFHSARHTFAMNALDADIDLYTISKLLGHADIKTTEIYAKVSNEKKQKAMDMMPKMKI